MPAALTYPGVYVEEIPSGVRTITGVATSITAFLGRALQGQTDEPITINSFGDFERTFGGLHVDYPMSYAVRDFYLNGGSQAIIVRLYKAADSSNENDTGVPDPAGNGEILGEAAPTQKTGKAELTVDGLKLTAKSPGEWGNKLRAIIDVEIEASDEDRKRLGLDDDDVLFNLIIQLGDTNDAPRETFLNLTVAKNATRRIDRILKEESSVVECTSPDFSEDIQLADYKKGVLDKKKEASDKKNTLDAKKLAFSKAPKDEAKKTAYEQAEKAYEQAEKDYENAVTFQTDTQKELSAALSADPQDPDKIQAAKEAIKDMDGEPLTLETDYTGSEADKTGLYALEKADLFNLLCIPPDSRVGDGNTTPNDVYQKAMGYCMKRRAILIVDSPAEWGKNKETAAQKARDGLSELGLSGTEARNAALYFPRVLQKDPLREGQLDTFVPCGIIAGRMAHTDATRGVWKAPAGLDASLNGIQGLQANLNDAENGMLNPLGINCLRSFPVNGRVIWGARTLRGADQLADEWKYIPVRRTALFIEESLYRGTQWVVFEPNDEPLWAQIRMNVGSFMHTLFRQGAFQGTAPKQAYFVKCDKESTTQSDIDRGIVNIVVGFAPLKPAEFVVIKLQQIAGELEF